MDSAPPPISEIEYELTEPGDLRDCLEAWLAELPVEVTSLRVELRVKDGRIVRIRFDQGLAAPQCVRDLLLDRVIDEDEPLVYVVTF